MIASHWENGDLIVRLAIWAGIGSLVLTLFMVASILGMRGLFLRRDGHRRRFVELWRPIFVEALFHQPRSCPPLRGDERLYFLYLFNHYHSLMKGENRLQLNRLADLAGIRDHVREMASKGNMPRRIIASCALGSLMDVEAFGDLLDGAYVENTILSQASATATMKIDPVRAVPVLLPALLLRNDWPASDIDALLAVAGKEAVSPVLKDMVTGIDEKHAAKLIRLLGSADWETASHCIGFWLERARRDETISACLQMLNDAHYLPLVRSYTKHPTWYLRLQAVATLGRIGHRDDVGLIARMLTDKEWWVRYRAASVLAEMPFLSDGDIAAIRDSQQDRYARDIMEHVMAEKRR